MDGRAPIVFHVVETTKHKLWVAWYIVCACLVLLKRAALHDLSKYSKREAPYFRIELPRLRGLEYGSTEYREAIKRLGPALYHHYKVNSHHPEYWSGNIHEMSPLDQIEMLCDWKAAGRRHATGNMAQSLEVNRERFKSLRVIHDALERAAREIGLLDGGGIK